MAVKETTIVDVAKATLTKICRFIDQSVEVLKRQQSLSLQQMLVEAEQYKDSECLPPNQVHRVLRRHFDVMQRVKARPYADKGTPNLPPNVK